MRHAAAVAGVAASLALAAAACGGSSSIDGPAGEWDAVLVIGAAQFDPAADAAAFPTAGDTFTERWSITCDDAGCTLARPDGGVLLGDLDGAVLVPDPETPDRLVAEVEGVRPAPAATPEDEDPCAATPATSWSVRIEVQRSAAQLVGSVIRIPEALVAPLGDADCYGLDLTLGVAGSLRSVGEGAAGRSGPVL